MWRRRTTAILATLLLLTTALAPVATAETPLAVDVGQDATGAATVTVTHEGAPVENATVVVDAPNATYAGEGSYETDGNGTVSLPAPAEDVTVDVTAANGSLSGSTTVVLASPGLDVAVEQDDEGNVTATITNGVTGDPVGGANVTVATTDENATYAGTGEYTTDENGSVDLPAPDADVEVVVAATHGELSGETTVELFAAAEEPDDEADSFGARVSAFVHSLLGDRGDGHPGIGRSVAAWVLGHNPGNPPAHAGPPDHAGPTDDAEGPPGQEGDDADENASASGPIDGSDDDSDDAAVGDGDDAGSDGPPPHAGPPDDRGNGKAKGR